MPLTATDNLPSLQLDLHFSDAYDQLDDATRETVAQKHADLVYGTDGTMDQVSSTWTLPGFSSNPTAAEVRATMEDPDGLPRYNDLMRAGQTPLVLAPHSSGEENFLTRYIWVLGERVCIQSIRLFEQGSSTPYLVEHPDHPGIQSTVWMTLAIPM